MMTLLYDEDLVEGVVFLYASGRRRGIAPLQIRRFHVERERLYGIGDPEERNAAFFRLNLEWLREWGAERTVRGALERFPRLERALEALAFRKCHRRSDEGAELFVNGEATRKAVLALAPERFVRDEPLLKFLHHELMHLDDMVAPAFGYSPELPTSNCAEADAPLIRGRYRLLWDITIDGRLTARGWPAESTETERRAEFERAFPFWPEPRRRELFGWLWHGETPTHSGLLALAADPRDLKSARRPAPGAACPLCGFPTFEWADANMLSRNVRDAIECEFPDWSKEQGICGRCLEVYQAREPDPFISPTAQACGANPWRAVV